MISELIAKLQEKTDLNYQQMNDIMVEILSGKTTDKQNVDFLLALTKKGETDDELLGMLDKMHKFSLKIKSENQDTLIDMCGTGGDSLETFNVSTSASFVVAAAGGMVAKHGNRSSSSSKVGSADIFEYFGYDLNQEPDRIAQILEKHKICFMFAQKFHPAVKHIAVARKQITGKTAFNLLGPLSNPACVKNQLVGVYSIDYLDRLAIILKKNGAKNIMTVHSDNGMDEFSTSAINRVVILENDKMTKKTIDAESVGLHKSSLAQIQVKTKDEAIRSFVNVLHNTANQAMIETTALNAAGGLVIANITNDFEKAVEIALETISSGKAYKVLKEFVKDTGDINKLEEIVN